MRRAIVLGLAALTLSCGDDALDESGHVGVLLTGASALRDVAVYELRVFGSAASCSQLRGNPIAVRRTNLFCGATGADPDLRADCILGRWTIDPSIGRGRLGEVPVGIRTLSVLALDGAVEDEAARIVGHGCIEGVEIRQGEAAQLELALTEI